jgi:hypothetical protein
MDSRRRSTAVLDSSMWVSGAERAAAGHVVEEPAVVGGRAEEELAAEVLAQVVEEVDREPALLLVLGGRRWALREFFSRAKLFLL